MNTPYIRVQAKPKYDISKIQLFSHAIEYNFVKPQALKQRNGSTVHTCDEACPRNDIETAHAGAVVRGADMR